MREEISGRAKHYQRRPARKSVYGKNCDERNTAQFKTARGRQLKAGTYSMQADGVHEHLDHNEKVLEAFRNVFGPEQEGQQAAATKGMEVARVLQDWWDHVNLDEEGDDNLLPPREEDDSLRKSSVSWSKGKVLRTLTTRNFPRGLRDMSSFLSCKKLHL